MLIHEKVKEDERTLENIESNTIKSKNELSNKSNNNNNNNKLSHPSKSPYLKIDDKNIKKNYLIKSK